MPQAVSPTVGWAVVHLFCRAGAEVDAAGIEAAVKATTAADHQVITAATVGHKADVCFMALGPDLWVLRRLQAGLRAAGLDVVDSYVSVTEVSEYAQGMPEEHQRNRLYPQLPPAGKPAFCFYPMSKRRGDAHNWYALPFEERKALMLGHGAVGRTFAGRILQLITGSTGLDDWEWGVTLFGAHLDDLKDVVYSMRFDPASALFAEFGPFITGMVGELDEVMTELGWR